MSDVRFTPRRAKAAPHNVKPATQKAHKESNPSAISNKPEISLKTKKSMRKKHKQKTNRELLMVIASKPIFPPSISQMRRVCSRDHIILLRIWVMSAWLKSKARSSLAYEAKAQENTPQSLPFSWLEKAERK